MAWPRLLVLGEDEDTRAITPEAAPLTRAVVQEQELSGALLMPAELIAMLAVELDNQIIQDFVCLLVWQLRVDVTRSSTSEVFSLWRI